MSSTIRYKKIESDEVQSGPHPHYADNLALSARICKKSDGKLPNGLSVKILDSGGTSSRIRESIIMLAWQPPQGAKAPTYAKPISLHKDSDSFKRDLKYTFNQLHGMAKRFWDAERKRNQPELF